MSDAHSADELTQALGVEEVADHAIALALVEATFRSAGDDAACVLASDREASIVPVGAGVGVGERRHAGGGNRADRSRVLCQLGVDIERSHREQSRSADRQKEDGPAVLEELETFGKLGRDIVLGREEDSEDSACGSAKREEASDCEAQPLYWASGVEKGGESRWRRQGAEGGNWVKRAYTSWASIRGFGRSWGRFRTAKRCAGCSPRLLRRA